MREYLYLGVTFTQTALYETATKQFLSKAKTACASTVALIHKLKITSRDTFIKLYRSLVSSIMLYSAPIYAVRYLQEVEKIQSLFFKRLLCVPQCTPKYALRLELGLPHIAVGIFKQVLNWIIKLLHMPDNRYPKICFLKQLTLANKDCKIIKYNWVLQIKKTFFEPIGEAGMWDNLNSVSLLNKKQYLCKAYADYLYEIDRLNCTKSTTLMIYPDIKLQEGAQKYLNLKLSISICRLIAQIRLMSNTNSRIIIDSELYKINNSLQCYYCNKDNDFFHMICECSHFVNLRESVKLPLAENKNLMLLEILENPRKQCLNNFVKYVREILNSYRIQYT